MPGISSVGAYIPKYRLPRSVFAQAWGSGGGAGERAVASYDEDTLSLAVNAAVDALNAQGRDDVDAVFFASTTAPYKEKSSGLWSQPPPTSPPMFAQPTLAIPYAQGQALSSPLSMLSKLDH